MDEQEILILGFESLVTCGEGVSFRTLAIENELLALAFGALSELGFEVWIRNGCGLN